MKYFPALFALAVSTVSAQTTPITVTFSGVTSRQVTVQIGEALAIADIFPFPATPPISVEAGTDLKLLALPPGSTYGPVIWYKDGKQLAADGGTLEITSTVAGDSGHYSCQVVSDSFGDTANSDDPAIFVASHTAQRLLNFSTEATIGASQPTVTTGFVVEPGPGVSPVLVRAVGPTLGSFGVADFLPMPTFQVLDSKGNVVTPYAYPEIIIVGPPQGAVSQGAITAAAAVGAFPLLSNSADAAQVYELSAGSYSVQVSSGDGSGGVVLVEIYEAPFL